MGNSPLRQRALAVLSDGNLDFWYSPLLRLEVLLLPSYHKRKIELEFHNTYFSQGNCFGSLDRMFEIGEPEALRRGIAVMDALHLAAAHLAKCDWFVTTEKRSKPMFQNKLIKVASISDVDATESSFIVQKLLR